MPIRWAYLKRVLAGAIFGLYIANLLYFLNPQIDITPGRLATVSECIGVTTNNVAEYRALIAGLQAAAATPARAAKVRGDSKLVIEQLAGRWKVKQPHLQPLHAQARALLDAYDEVDLGHVRREQNAEADALVNAALDLP